MFAPVLPNQTRDDAGSQGQSGGQSQGGEADAHALANQIKNLSGTGVQRVAQNLAARTRMPTVPTDSVLANLGPAGVSTFTRGSLRRAAFEPGGKFSSLQGRQLRVAGEMPSEWASQVEGERLAVSVQTRPMNWDFVANGRYNVPLRV